MRKATSPQGRLYDARMECDAMACKLERMKIYGVPYDAIDIDMAHKAMCKAQKYALHDAYKRLERLVCVNVRADAGHVADRRHDNMTRRSAHATLVAMFGGQ